MLVFLYTQAPLLALGGRLHLHTGNVQVQYPIAPQRFAVPLKNPWRTTWATK